ncbi:MAG TPA: ABC transporter permease [Pyrinomonadaceae bacterium]|nr:ABC transporter permease [Pyrinomonadaceae bacterium]
MPYELFLALRYLRVRRGRRVARWTALAAVVGIACGVAALIFALALANGFRDELRDKILRGTAHVTLSRGGGGADVRAAAGRARRVEGVADAEPTTYEGALLTGGGGSTYAVLRGLDRDSARAAESLKGSLTEGSLDAFFKTPRICGEIPPNSHDDPCGGNPPDADPSLDAFPVVLGEELAERTGLKVGERGWVLTGVLTPEPNVYAPLTQPVRVVGTFRSGLYEYDSSWAYLSLDNVSRVVGGRLSASVVSVEARDMYASRDVAGRLREEFGGGWEAADWGETNRALFDALALERRTVALIIMLITVVAALNITTTLALVVVERRADIAVLVALGARARSVTLVFMLEGAIVGALGALAGVALGLAACFAADRFSLVRLPADVYSLSAVPLHPHASDVLVPALAAFAVSLLATLYPALQAARVRPAEVLRYE